MSVAPLTPPPMLNERLLAPLERLRRELRRHLLVRGVLLFLLALVGAGLVQLLVDRGLRLSVDQRVAMNVAITIAWLAVLWRYVGLPLLRPLPDDRLAGWIDAATPALEDRVQTAVELSRGGEPLDPLAERPSVELSQAVLLEACAQVGPAAFERLVDRRGLRHRLWAGVGVLALVSIAWVVRTEMMSVWFQRNWLLRDLAWPQRTYIVPQGFDSNRTQRLPRGEQVEIYAEVQGDLPKSTELTWIRADGSRGSQGMTIVGGRKLYAELGVLTEDLTFQISGGDEHTSPHRIIAVERPRITFTRFHVEPPAYTGLEPIEFEQQTTVELLRGSRVKISAQISKPARLVQFRTEEGLVLDLQPSVAEPPASAVEPLSPDGAARAAAATWTVAWQNPHLSMGHFEIEDEDGLANQNPVRYVFKVTADQAPGVQLALPGVGELITPLAHFNASLQVEDVYGLGAVELALQRNEETPLPQRLPALETRARRYQAQVKLDAEWAQVKPGDRLWVRAAAEDLDPAGPNRGEGQVYSLLVVPREDFEQAMAQRELELRAEFERLLAAQKSLGESFQRVATDLPESGSPPVRESQRLVGLMRRQTAHAARCGAIARRYGEMLEEMRTSRVARMVDEQRIGDRIQRPLQLLETQSMPAVATAWAALREQSTADNRQLADDTQVRVLREMQAVYQNMLEWEGYREAVNTLRSAIEQQAQVRQATIAELERELADILGLEPQPESRPASGPSDKP